MPAPRRAWGCLELRKAAMAPRRAHQRALEQLERALGVAVLARFVHAGVAQAAIDHCLLDLELVARVVNANEGRRAARPGKDRE